MSRNAPKNDGRTLHAYDPQHRPRKWACNLCIQALKQERAAEGKTLAQNETNDYTFDSKLMRDRHLRSKHGKVFEFNRGQR